VLPLVSLSLLIVMAPIERPEVFLCGKGLVNAGLKPEKLKELLTFIHHKKALSSVDSFCSKKALFQKAGTLPKLGFITTQKPYFEASFEVIC